MKPPCLWVSVALLLLTPCAAGAQIPDRIPAPGGAQNDPIWVSAAQATTPDGRFKSELFNPLEAQNVERLIQAEKKAREAAGISETATPAGCKSWLIFPENPDVDPLTLEGLLDHSRLAFIGTVEDQQLGFYHSHPNSLLQIKVQRVLKAPPGYEAISTVLATYPQVEMKVGDEMVCVRADRYKARPITGKGIMILARNIPDWDPLIVAANTDGILFEDGEGNAVLPSRFSKLADALTWTALVHKALDLADAPGTKDGQAR